MFKLRNFFKSNPEILTFIMFVLGALLTVYITNNYFGVFAPFIISFVVVKLLRPLMVFFEKKLKLPKTLNALLCMFIFTIFAALIIWFFISNVISGIEYVVNLVTNNVSVTTIMDTFTKLEAQLADWGDMLDLNLDLTELASSIYEVAKGLITVLSNFSIGIIAGIPSFLISFIIGCIASFYMLCDYDKMSNFIQKQLSPQTQAVLDVLNNNVFTSLLKMILSYVFISVVCFVELGIGFWILGIKDAWFIAFIIAIFDVLPIVGSGGILTPWGIAYIILGDPVRGIGLLVLWGVIVVVRQIIEPKVVGSQIGLHPLLTIMALYVGLELMGGLGLIMGPLYLIACKKINESGLIKIYKE